MAKRMRAACEGWRRYGLPSPKNTMMRPWIWSLSLRNAAWVHPPNPALMLDLQMANGAAS